MKFKTKPGEDAYKEIISDVSERAARMYHDVKVNPRLSEVERFQMNLAIEQFQAEGIARAIALGTNIDATWSGLKGSLTLAASQIGG